MREICFHHPNHVNIEFQTTFHNRIVLLICAEFTSRFIKDFKMWTFARKQTHKKTVTVQIKEHKNISKPPI